MKEYRFFQIIQVCFVIWAILTSIFIFNDKDEFHRKIYTDTKIHKIEEVNSKKYITWSGYDEKNKKYIKEEVSERCGGNHIHYNKRKITVNELKSGVINNLKGGLVFIYTIIGFFLGVLTAISFTIFYEYQSSSEDALKINIWKAKFYGDVLVFFGHSQDEVEELVKKKIELIERAAKFYKAGWKVLTYEEIKRESF
jgi:hypothetical protein